MNRFCFAIFVAMGVGATATFAQSTIPIATNTVAATPLQGYTNHAGHVLVGTWVSADARSATLRLPSGTERKLPLNIFSASERERIGIASGTLPPPPAVAEAFERCRLALQRIDVLVQAGQQTAVAAETSRDLERRAVRAMLADLEQQKRLSPAAAAYLSSKVP